MCYKKPLLWDCLNITKSQLDITGQAKSEFLLQFKLHALRETSDLLNIPKFLQAFHKSILLVTVFFLSPLSYPIQDRFCL